MTLPVTEAGIREKLARVRENVAGALERSGRGPDGVRVLVASKYYAPEQIGALSAVGVDLVGENRAEELVEKQELFGDAFEWHFIGHLQRRKAKIVAPRVSLVHSVDSVRLVEELAGRAAEGGIEVLFQVNVSGEESKYGVAEDEIEGLLEAAAATEGRVRARGFMTIAPLVEEAERVRYVFAKLRSIRDRLRGSWSPHFDLSELSMGMSSDYEVAVEEGATVVRIGRMLIEEDGPVRRHDGS
ncbi:MAG: YggS family pyridoxal phosphate-dependent enzyme [Rubrobacter sp.]|nr:YggS family pyridoxal phosphate-dependent enzyme [Rubrobacteraceae bacterium]MBA3792584.1 YggS family pyridoxal phosphate-dependent enzyme [Rubrobacter sp.]MDQ3316264.1 YggS family pyridoxal phosphate-dependent enzyme [Actinomycetota bacterium]MDQ3429361.1 YggS family pyridoxal phosphate-dependent enzyme [Actinomycetota bacterium]